MFPEETRQENIDIRLRKNSYETLERQRKSCERDLDVHVRNLKLEKDRNIRAYNMKIKETLKHYNQMKAKSQAVDFIVKSEENSIGGLGAELDMGDLEIGGIRGKPRSKSEDDDVDNGGGDFVLLKEHADEAEMTIGFMGRRRSISAGCTASHCRELRALLSKENSLGDEGDKDARDGVNSLLIRRELGSEGSLSSCMKKSSCEDIGLSGSDNTESDRRGLLRSRKARSVSFNGAVNFNVADYSSSTKTSITKLSFEEDGVTKGEDIEIYNVAVESSKAQVQRKHSKEDMSYLPSISKEEDAEKSVLRRGRRRSISFDEAITTNVTKSLNGPNSSNNLSDAVAQSGNKSQNIRKTVSGDNLVLVETVEQYVSRENLKPSQKLELPRITATGSNSLVKINPQQRNTQRRRAISVGSTADFDSKVRNMRKLSLSQGGQGHQAHPELILENTAKGNSEGSTLAEDFQRMKNCRYLR